MEGQTKTELLAALEVERRRITAEFQQRMARIDQAAAALDAAFGEFQATTAALVQQQSLVKSTSTLDALVKIGQESVGGVISVREAAHRLLDAGIIRPGRNQKVAASAAHDVVSQTMRRRPKLFEKAGVGQWRLRAGAR